MLPSAVVSLYLCPVVVYFHGLEYVQFLITHQMMLCVHGISQRLDLAKVLISEQETDNLCLRGLIVIGEGEMVLN